jgi:hypothetical protein
VVGNTAHLLLEIDESQDVNKEKYTRDFKPMGATTNVTTVHYGTTWDESTLLEEIKQTNLELQKRDGIRRHFRYDWQEVAKYNPDYLIYVENERQRLGENHPLFLTQYCLQPVRGNGGFLSPQQKAQLQGTHPRKHSAEKGITCVAGIDIAGETYDGENTSTTVGKTVQDATVLTIAELDFTAINEIQKQPTIRIVEHYVWRGIRHTDLYQRLSDLLKNIWGCKRIIVDSTGMGQPIASFLRQALGSRVVPFVFTAPSKSKLGFDLLASINSGRLKMYEGDGSQEFQEFWLEIDNARSEYRPSQTINFFVDPSRGHDDFLMSLALVVEAANGYQLRQAKGNS